jgi:hypothetical protein
LVMWRAAGRGWAPLRLSGLQGLMEGFVQTGAPGFLGAPHQPTAASAALAAEAPPPRPRPLFEFELPPDR